MALSSNRELDHYIDQELRSLPVAGSALIYKGAFVGLSAGGYARPLAAGDLCVGIAYEEMNNTNGADGDKSVRLYTLGDFGHPLGAATVSDIGSAIYASDDETLTLTSTGNSYVGTAVDVPTGGAIILRLDTFRAAP